MEDHGRFVCWDEENGYFITSNWLEAGYLEQRQERVCSEGEGHIIYKRHSNAV